MENNERVRRPVPDRTKPNRNILGALGQSDAKSGIARPQSNSSQTMHPLGPGFSNPDDAKSSTESDGSNASGYIDSSVRAASDLIDAHIRQGQETAKSMKNGRSVDGSLQSNLPELLTGLMRAYSDVAAVWVDVASTLTQSIVDTKTEPQRQPRNEQGNSQIGLKVVCNCSVEANIEIHHPSTDLIAQPLVAANGATMSQINDVNYEAAVDGGFGKICVRIERDQPAGSYHGLLLTAGGEAPAGVLTIRILDAKDSGMTQ